MLLAPGVLVWFLLSAFAAAWITVDYRARTDGPGWERLAWTLGTLLALPIFLPIYLVAARPPGRLVRCPACGRPTLGHRASCRHCGTPIAFEPPPRRWGLGEVVGISVVFMFTLPFVAASLGVDHSPALPVLSALVIAQDAALIGLSLYVVQRRYGRPAAELGLTPARWPRWALLGSAAGLVMIPLTTQVERLAVALIGLAVGRARAETMAEQEHLGDVLRPILEGPLTPVQLGLIVVLICGFVPVAEEIFFRGLAYGTLRRWGVAPAALLSALFFAAVHNQVVHFLPIFVLGAVLALLYEWTGSLVAPILVHAVNNVVAILTVLYGWQL